MAQDVRVEGCEGYDGGGWRGVRDMTVEGGWAEGRRLKSGVDVLRT